MILFIEDSRVTFQKTYIIVSQIRMHVVHTCVTQIFNKRKSITQADINV